MNDIQLAVRALMGTPVIALAAVLSLALGIGANTSIFSLVNSLMLRPLPVTEAERLAVIVDPTIESRAWSNPLWEEIRRRADRFDGAFAWSPTRYGLNRGSERQFVSAIRASGDFFSVLGVRAALGRTFTADDDRPGGGPEGPVAVISDEFWRRHFGGSHAAISNPLTLGSVTFTVIGITPAGFFGPDVGRRFDVILPIGTEPLLTGSTTSLDSPGQHWLFMMVRRRPGQTLEGAASVLRQMQQEIRDSLPQESRLQRDLRNTLALSPGAQGRSPLRAQYGEALIMLLIVSVGVLVIACVNVANLMLARTAARRHEMSMRVALGASRVRLARMLLVEAAVLSGTGAACGVALAHWMNRLIVRQISAPDNVVFFLELTPDWRVWMFASAAAIGTAVLFGAAPALQSTKADPVEAIKEHGRGHAGGRSWASTLLVSAQLALSLVLIVAAGLFLRTSTEMGRRHVGATRDRVLIAAMNAPMTRYTPERLVSTYERVLDEVRRVPGVEQVALSDITPAEGSARVDGDLFFNVISPGWLQTYGVRLLAGRDLLPTDRLNTPPVALVNQAYARRFLGGANPVGQFSERAVPGTGVSGAMKIQIVGLVEDTIYRSLRESSMPTMYTSTLQRPQARPFASVSVLAAADPIRLIRSVTTAIQRVDSELIWQVRPLNEQVAEAMAQERLVAVLSGFFGALALLLSALGLYGVTAYSVNRRRPEIALRMALGSGRARVLSAVMRRIAAMSAIGIVCGAILSLWAVQFVEGLVWGIEPRDPVTFAAAAAVLSVVTGVSGMVPAWRATRVDPAAILKDAT
jgi:putative ABC transport system permease protein